MGIISELEDGISGLLGANKGLLGTTLAAGAAGAAAGALITGGALTLASRSRAKRASSRRKSSKKITHTKRGWKQDRKRRSKQKWEVAYQKRKKRKGIHYTKAGQPYIILASGKAKFIKKRR